MYFSKGCFYWDQQGGRKDPGPISEQIPSPSRICHPTAERIPVGTAIIMIVVTGLSVFSLASARICY